MKDGEVYGELVETDSSVYILRMDKVNDEDATASKKESLENTKRGDYYTETTQKWLDDAEITVDDKVFATLTITDNHSFTIKEVAADTSEDTEAKTDETEDSADATDSKEDSAAEDSEKTDNAEDSTADEAAEDSSEADTEDTAEGETAEEN